MRLAHLHFNEGKPVRKDEYYDRVVTVYWTFEPDVSILTYGATVFKKEYSSDHWKKKEHKQKALERYRNNPIRIHLISKEQNPKEIENFAMDWFVAKNLVFYYGAYHKGLDVRRIHGEKEIPSNFNSKYSFLKEEEEDWSWEEEETASNCGSWMPFIIVAGTLWGTAIFTRFLLL